VVFIQAASTAAYSAGYNVIGTVMNNSTVENSGFIASDNIPTSSATVNTIETIFGANKIANQGGVSDVIAPTANAQMDMAALQAVISTWPVDDMAKVMDLTKDQRRYTRATTTIAGSYDPNGTAPTDEDEPYQAIDNVSISTIHTGVYSLLGHYLGEDINALPSGVYVVNGQKVIK